MKCYAEIKTWDFAERFFIRKARVKFSNVVLQRQLDSLIPYEQAAFGTWLPYLSLAGAKVASFYKVLPTRAGAEVKQNRTQPM